MKHLLFFLLFLSCGYHCRRADQKPTISIPYVPSDYEGQLTSELARQIAASGGYTYVRSGGELTLKVAIVGDASDRIGFRYDRKETSGKIEHNLMPTENRRTLTAEVTLLETATDKIVAGPTEVQAFAEFDYVDVNSLKDLSFVTSSGKRQTVLNYSLGQLDSVEGAQDDAMLPIYRLLAQKIVTGLLQVSH
jgi:hypothetical protein